MILRVRETLLRLGWWLGLIVSGAMVLLGALVYLVGRESLGALMLMALGLGAGLSWGLAWWMLRQSIVLPLRELADMTETLAAKDSLALAGALAQLGRGDLTV